MALAAADADRRDRRRRLDAGVPRDGHRHGQADGRRAGAWSPTTASTSPTRPTTSPSPTSPRRPPTRAGGDRRPRRHAPCSSAGTGLYLRAVTDPMEIPGRWPEVRAALEAARRAERQRGAARRAGGRSIRWPRRASSRPTRRRVVRALEVTIGSGRPFSCVRAGHRRLPAGRVRPWSGCAGRARCSPRASPRGSQRMMDAGLLDEVERLAAAPRRLVADRPPGARLQGAARAPRRRASGSTTPSTRSSAAPASSPCARSDGSVATPAYAGWTSATTRSPRCSPPRQLDEPNRRPMTRQLTLTKHQALGNDFLVVFHARRRRPRRARPPACATAGGGSAPTACSSAPTRPATTPGWCCTTPTARRAEMSGNGIRCFAQALADAARSSAPAADPHRRRPATGDDHARASDPTGSTRRWTWARCADIAEPDGWQRIGADPHRPVRHLSLGNPHAVVGVEDVAAVDLARHRRDRAAGQRRDHRARPGGQRRSRCASTSAAPGSPRRAAPARAPAPGRPRRGAWCRRAPPEILVHMDGGDAKVRLHEPSTGRVTLIGPAERIAT